MKSKKSCPLCGYPLKFIRYQFDKTHFLFGTSSKVYQCTGCGAVFKVKRGDNR